MPKKTKDESLSAGKAAALGAGVVALAAASYFFFGPDGKKNRNNLKSWMIKMKGEVIEKIEAAQEVTEELYHKIVDTVTAKYVKAGKVGEAEVRMFADMLKSQWKGITRSHAKTTASAAKTVKKVAKK